MEEARHTGRGGRWLGGLPADVRRTLLAKAVRSFGDGFASIAIAAYLSERGFGPVAIGVLAAVALLGTSLAMLAIGFFVDRVGRRRTLLAASLVMVVSGVAFAAVGPFWLLLVVAFLGTVNPSQGDVSVFLPVEQALLSNTVRPERRTWLYARYQLSGRIAAATGSLASGLAGVAAGVFGWPLVSALRLLFVAYGALGLVLHVLYRGLTPRVELHAGGATAPAGGSRAAPDAHPGLRESRGIVARLSALFAVDAFGGGLIVNSVLVLWLFERFGLSVQAAGTIFFVVGVLGAGSMLLAAPIADRIGLIQTMAYTHLPSNIALLLVPLAPSLPLALALLFLRSGLSQMDTAPRTAFIVSVVAPEERAAAMSVTGVVRSLSTAAGPSLGGALLAAGPFGLPLLVSGAMKAGYDVVLLALFRRVPLRAEPAAAGDADAEDAGARVRDR